MDSEFLARITPGITRLVRTGEDTFEAIADIKMGPVKGSFSGEMAIQDKQEPDSFTLAVSQKSKIGNVAAAVNMSLEALSPDVTKMTFDGKAKLSGVLARMGQRVLSGVASTLTKQFFSALEEELSKPAA